MSKQNPETAPNQTREEINLGKRTLTRLIAAQILYQFNFFDEKREIAQIKNDLLENYTLFEEEKPQSYKKRIDENFLDELLSGSLIGKENLLAEIGSLKQNKTLEIDEILKEILLLAAFELKYKKNPSKVIINEYTSIAALFFEEAKVNFANFIISNLAKKHDEQ